jgi:hypothetical protein
MRSFGSLTTGNFFSFEVKLCFGASVVAVVVF